MPNVLIIIWLCFWLFIPVSAFCNMVVDLKSEAVVSTKTIVLSDLAEVRGDDAQLISGILIARSTDGSSGLNISAKTVENKVRSHYMGPVSFTGASMTHVSSCKVEVPEEIIKKVFIEEIIKNSPWRNSGRIEVDNIRVSRIPKVLRADLSAIQAKFSSHERYLGFVTATMIIGSSILPEKVAVTGKVKLMADIPIIKSRVGTGKIIMPSDLEMRDFDISSCPNVYSKMEDCIGKQSKVMLREGYPVLPSQVRRKPDIRSGELIIIEAQVKNLIVRDKGIALKDGYQGEVISVKNVASGRQVVGTIIAQSLVQVNL